MNKFKYVNIAIAYLHMFIHTTYHLTMVIVGSWQSRLQSLAHAIIAYLHMFKYQLNGDLYILAYLHVFKDSTNHLTMVIVGGWRPRFQSVAHTISYLR